jgi:hypothetical protein
VPLATKSNREYDDVEAARQRLRKTFAAPSRTSAVPSPLQGREIVRALGAGVLTAWAATATLYYSGACAALMFVGAAALPNVTSTDVRNSVYFHEGWIQALTAALVFLTFIAGYIVDSAIVVRARGRSSGMPRWGWTLLVLGAVVTFTWLWPLAGKRHPSVPELTGETIGDLTEQ